MKMQSYQMFLITICCFMITSEALAQDLKPKKDSLAFYKWDASLDVLNLFRGYQGVMIRYGPRPNGAFRVAIGSLSHGTQEHFQYVDTTGAIQPQVYKSRIFNLRINLGYEWRKNYGRHQLFYGTDLNVYYNWAREYVITMYPAKILSIGIHPFVGLKYRIVNRLSISAETNFSANYSVLKNFGSQNRVVSKSRNYGFGFNPLHLINLSYHF